MMKMDKLKFYEATVGNGIRIDSAKTICSALNLNFDEWFDVKVISSPYAKERYSNLDEHWQQFQPMQKGKDWLNIITLHLVITLHQFKDIKKKL